MTDVIGVLRQEHESMAALLDTLEAQLDALEQDALPDYDVIRGVINYFLSFPDIYHHPKENLIYARLKGRDAGAASRIGDLRIEHEKLGARSRAVGKAMEANGAETGLSHRSFLQSGRDFVALQRQHIEMEEALFLPVAQHALTADDWHDLETVMRDGDDPLLGEAVGAHFEAIRCNILGSSRRRSRDGGT